MSDDVLDRRLDRVLGKRTANALHRAFGMDTVGDLLTHFPRRYAHRGELTPIRGLALDEQVTIVAEVVEARTRRMRARKGSILDVRITDGEGMLTLTFFNQEWREAKLRPGARGIFSGKISEYRGSLQLAHPDYELFDADDDGARQDAEGRSQRPIPIYGATASVASHTIAASIGLVLDAVGPDLDASDPVPQQVRDQEGLMGLREAMEAVHRPNDDGEASAARAALRFHEAFVLQVALLQQRARLAAQPGTAYPTDVAGGLVAQLDARLPFALTEGQRRVADEIAADLARATPMNRLLQGEVGSGKTVLALRAMLQVAQAGGQAALIAPTEVLAQQHYRTISSLLGPDLLARIMPVLVTGSQDAASRRRTALQVVTGQARIVVGTHALLSDSTEFYDLGLVVVDEQHRFGVDQREKLAAKAGATRPHVLMLTATPIPRTVAMTVFGDLDISSLRERPNPGAGVSSFVVPLAEKPAWETRVWQRLAEEVAAGHQGYVVCTLIEAGTGTSPERADVGTVMRMLAQNPATAHLRVGALHGRLAADEKRRVMVDFEERRLDVLVATTVIEVGVNVPNATVIVVLDADAFGIAQLHQLRGRVGRGDAPGVALLVTRAPEGSEARARVDAVAQHGDGFELADIDLQLRHEGDVLGAVQSGSHSTLRLLQVVPDAPVIERARALAQPIVAAGVERHPALARAVERALRDVDEGYLTTS